MERLVLITVSAIIKSSVSLDVFVRQPWERKGAEPENYIMMFVWEESDESWVQGAD